MSEEYKKEFDLWNAKKKEIEQSNVQRLCHEREVWWCSLGVNIGSEQDGKNELFERPVLILKRYSMDLILILPITSTEKDNVYYVKINSVMASSVILSQIRAIDSKRLLRKVGMLSIKDYLLVLFNLFKTLLP
jgi:mRNA-degrading endonuclease toxin of MazEF toxin-antitoxin module